MDHVECEQRGSQVILMIGLDHPNNGMDQRPRCHPHCPDLVYMHGNGATLQRGLRYDPSLFKELKL